jgi:excisionase family DNA binding protein
MEEKLYTIDELSKYLNIPKSTIYKLSQKSEIPACKIGKQLRYRKSSIDKWLSEKETYSAKPIFISRPASLPQTQINKRILLVDDDRMVLRTITKLLTIYGYAVEPAESGEEAIEKIKRSDFDLLITDIRMPGINGIETIKRIRDLNVNATKSGMPEIVITGFVDTAIEEEARSIGITDYMYKPFATTDFINAVEKKLEIKHE